MKKKNLLPDNPSELLIVAMEDLEKIENLNTIEEVKINMVKWFDENPFTGDCKVCHAGAVIYDLIKEKNTITDDDYYCLVRPSCFDGDTERKLYAINSARLGNINCFFNYLGIENPWINKDGSHLIGCGMDEKELAPDYYSHRKYDSKEDWEVYKNWIVSFIGILQAEGL
jgi:hypothetical protein